MSLDRRLQKLEDSAEQAGLDRPPRETWGPLLTYCALELMGLAVWDEVKGYWSPTENRQKRDWLKQRVVHESGEAIPDADAERVRYEWSFWARPDQLAPGSTPLLSTDLMAERERCLELLRSKLQSDANL